MVGEWLGSCSGRAIDNGVGRWSTARGKVSFSTFKCPRANMTPNSESSGIIYQEWFASGHSRKNIITMFGGARHCLRLVVTKDELRVTSWFPFSLFTAFYDLEHVVRRDQILSIRRSSAFLRSSIRVTFLDADRVEHQLNLCPWRQAEFLQSLGGETPATAESAGPGDGAFRQGNPL